MGNPIATQNSSSEHGGSPTSYATKVRAGGFLVLRLGDTFNCPVDNTVTVAEASGKVKAEGAFVARQDDHLSTPCGKKLTNGVATVLVG